MSLINTRTRYGSVTKTIHWLMALMVLTVIPLGVIAHDMAERIWAQAQPDDALIARTAWLFSLHKTLGVAIFFLALLRILWAASTPRPGLLNAENRIEAFLAHLIHWMLYGALLIMPLTGWIHHAASQGFAPILWPFGQTLPLIPSSEPVAQLFGALHHWSGYVLIAALALHIAGALKHHVIDKDATLRRMLPASPADLPTPPAEPASKVPALVAALIWLVVLGAGSVLGLASNTQNSGAKLEAVSSDWQVIDGKLGLEITQLGSAVTGQFEDWTAQIQFTPRTDPGPAGEVTVTVAIASLTLGSVTDQAMGPDFFDTDRFPTAVFTAPITRTDTGYAANGTLTLKGATVTVSLPFDLKWEGETAIVTGSATLDRMDFAIGASVTDAATLATPVALTVALSATRSSPPRQR